MMQMYVFELFVFLVAGACCSFNGQPLQDDVSSECVVAMETCAAKHVTSGRCKTTLGSLQLNLIRVDVDNNCQVNGSDFADSVPRFYDIDGDGELCRNEWIARRTRYLGFSTSLTEFEFNAYSPSGACMKMSHLARIPNIELRTVYTNTAVLRLINFCNQGDNMKTNRDCLGLPTICKEKRPELDACMQFDPTIKTLKQKIDGVFIDVGGDGLVFSHELGNDFTANYDTDQDMLMTNVVTACEKKPDLYLTNADCAQAVDTCLTYFPENDACAVYAQCGLHRYTECITGLTSPSGRCSSRTDSIEVELEGRRVRNQVAPECEPYTVEDIMACLNLHNFFRKMSGWFGY